LTSVDELRDLLAAEARRDPEFVAGVERHRDLPDFEALRRAGLSLWGAEPPRLPRVLEIDPRMLTASVSAAAVALEMDRHRAELLSLPPTGDSAGTWTPWSEPQPRR
jgi:hypothetical protein